jgi:ABC-2 type transport system ATP-binding protein
MTVVASLRGIRKTFGDATALDGVDLELRQGEILALLGPNGAGKTTTLDIAVGLRRPDDGTARLFGCDPRETRPRLKIGVTPQESGVPQLLRVGEVIELVRAHFPRPAPARETLDRFGLNGLESRQAGGLSGGQKRRLAVALAFAGSPEAVFLDEPSTGLDVEARRAIWSTIRDYVGRGGTVLLTTHYLEEAEALASRIVVLRRGRVVSDGSVGVTRDRLGTVRVRVRAGSLPELSGVTVRERNDDLWTLDCPDGDAFVRALVRSGLPFRSLEVERIGLEEVFLALTEAEP